MTADLVPAEVLAPAPPLTDDDLERYGAWAMVLADAAELPVPTVAGDLDLIASEDPNLPEPVRSWRIDGDRTAAWAMAKLQAADEELRHVAEVADEWHRQIDEWAAGRGKPLLATRAYMDAQLCDYALRLREATEGRTKSVKLPNGTVRTTGRPAKPAVYDEGAVLAWAKANLAPEQVQAVVKVTEHVSVTNWREVVQLDTVVDRAKVTLANCGCVVWYQRTTGFPPYDVCDRDSDPSVGTDPKVLGSLPAVPGVGDGTTCLACGADTLVGDVLVEVSHLVVVDETGNDVPGAEVEPEGVTAKVVPG